jgi:dTDP-4-amino-4,6-dideoxygalactose transaminase
MSSKSVFDLSLYCLHEAVPFARSTFSFMIIYNNGCRYSVSSATNFPIIILSVETGQRNCMSPTLSNNIPAILGGNPEFPKGPPDWPLPDEEILQCLTEAFHDGSWGKYQGINCDALKSAIAEYQNCEHVNLCSSGTSAIELALRGVQVQKGDEVILAGYDFDGNYRNIIYLGGRPVLVDLCPDNWNMDFAELKKAANKQTKAIIVSHLHGGVVPMKELMSFSKEKGIPVIEDACQMPGAVIQGEKAGSWGDIGVISFGGSKTLTAGRGGALFTNNNEIAQRINLIQNRGNEAYPLSELQAAVLIPQLKKLDHQNRIRSENVQFLEKELSQFSGLTLFRNIQANQSNENSSPGYYKVGFQYDPDEFSRLDRNSFCKAVQAEGIAIFPGFRSFHCIHSSRRFQKTGPLEQATLADHNCAVLHHPVLLKTEIEINKIVQAISKIKKHAAEISQSLSKPE